MQFFIVAIDGPAASGKSSVAQGISMALGIPCLNTGSMYRAITHEVLKANINPQNEQEIESLLNKIVMTYQKDLQGVYQLYCNGIICGDEIRTPEVAAKVSEVAAIAKVREYLVAIQRKITEHLSVVMEGRDIGTVVFPHAKHKFFLTASPIERARRRLNQGTEAGNHATLQSVAASIAERDHLDSIRAIAPLRQAEDAILIDSSLLTKEQTVEKMLSLIKGKKD